MYPLVAIPSIAATSSHSTTTVVSELSDSTLRTGFGVDGLLPMAAVVSGDELDAPN